jgi:hypothetical protein
VSHLDVHPQDLDCLGKSCPHLVWCSLVAVGF